MPKQGFKNQWIAISQTGKFKDSSGTERDLNEKFLSAVVANFAPSEAPAVVGHPKDNAPAYAWASALRLENGVLEAQFADTDDEFEQMVETGKFRKRSASFYMNPPSLRHVGFLGAQPPAVKGLRDIQFSDGEQFAVEISFNEEQTMSNENQNTQEEKKTFKEWMKEFFGGGGQSSVPTANFSDVEKQSLIDAAVAKAKEEAKKEVVAEFTEELKKRDTQIESLTTAVNANSASGKRAEIISFVEAIPAEKGKHFLKRKGIVEFMESLAADDKADAINFSEGEGDQKVEHKFSRLEWFKNYVSAQQNFVEFGEKFGSLTATADADNIISPEREKELAEKMGVAEGGAK